MHFAKVLSLIAALLLQPCRATTSNDEHEPPRNPFLADSSWPMTHRNTYNQGSTNLSGPTAYDTLRHDFSIFSGTPSITLAEGPDDTLWFHGPLSTGVVDEKSFKKTDSVHQPLTLNAFPGAYVLVDVDGIFYAFHDKKLSSFDVEGESISRRSSFDVPETLLRSHADYPLGLSMLFDGNLVFGTREGNLHVIDRHSFDVLDSIQLGGKQSPEELSNNIAVDENNGIFVVTSAKMRRIQWDGASLSVAWEASYNVGDDSQPAGRLGKGSGTAPSLMGTKEDDDRFVVIADNAELMNLVLFWRDEIPSDWVGLPGKDRRIAAEVPITFGKHDAKRSVTEQSVLVRGYGAVVVNNDYGVSLPSWAPDIFNQMFVLATNLPMVAPKGVEKFEWNPATRTLESVWSNDLSCPNGIPTMSEASDLVYCMGQRRMQWGVEAMSWSNGQSSFFKSLGYSVRYNSAYSAMQIMDNRQLLSGSIMGSVRIRVEEPSAEEPAKLNFWESLKAYFFGGKK